MKFAQIVLFVLFTSNAFSLFAQEESPKVSQFSIGETIQFDSNILDESRVVNVYLPHGYKKSDKEYPVIYLLDGSADEDFIHIAGLVQYGSFSWINMIPESIVVGISNVDRKRDFTYPSDNALDQKELPTGGGSEVFTQFIAQELQPLINKQYRTTATKTLIGQSLGGLLATEILFKQPELFDNYVIVSPSLWWDDESLLKLSLKKDYSNKKIFIAVGKEGEVMERVAKSLFQKLKNSKLPTKLLSFGFFEELSHGDTLHLAAYDALAAIFKISEVK